MLNLFSKHRLAHPLSDLFCYVLCDPRQQQDELLTSITGNKVFIFPRAAAKHGSYLFEARISRKMAIGIVISLEEVNRVTTD